MHRTAECLIHACPMTNPNAAVALLGKGGAMCSLLLIFMAVTSASSAPNSSRSRPSAHTTFYKTYINPRATGKQLIDHFMA
ncbi:hypothetical protein V1515DRAFT_592244 [Lipomyces mesembrius]